MERILAGKRALVVGGTGGIGAAISYRLALEGVIVRIHGGSSSERLRSLLERIHADGGAASGFLQRIDSPEDVPSLARELPDPDILVCALGPFVRKPLAETTPADWSRMALMGLAVPGALVSAYFGGMKERGFGRILLLGGTLTDTIRGFSTTAAYSAAKTGLGTLAKSVAKAGGPFGVGCNVLCPGFVDTEYVDEAARDYMRSRAPGGVLLNPGEIAAAAYEIVGNLSLSGAIITVDGGLSV